MVSIVSNLFHSSRLTFRDVKDSDVDALIKFIKRDNGKLFEWFGMAQLNSSKVSDQDKARKLIDIYKRNTTHKKHMLHIVKKHSADVLGVINIWTDLQNNKRVAVYLTKDMRRKNLGSEAQKRVLYEICKRDSKITKLVAQTDKDNQASIRSLCSIGFKLVGARRFASPPGYKDSNLSLTFLRGRVAQPF